MVATGIHWQMIEGECLTRRGHWESILYVRMDSGQPYTRANSLRLLPTGLCSQLVRVEYSGDSALWTPGKARKSHDCLGCQRTIEPGETAWREISGTKVYRSRRLCSQCTAPVLHTHWYCIECERKAARGEAGAADAASSPECCSGLMSPAAVYACRHSGDGPCEADEHHYGHGEHIRDLTEPLLANRMRALR